MASEGFGPIDKSFVQRLRVRFNRFFAQRNRLRRARESVAHHYDLSRAYYDLFPDADREYSCAYFVRGDETLEAAQAAKKRHIATKLLLKPGHDVLDIGSRWGALALDLARTERAHVTGITLSTEQLQATHARASVAGLSDRARFELRDFRDEKGHYDPIVSVGMLEHVGKRDYSTFFQSVARSLKPDGVALVHSIGRMDPPGAADPWIDKYIFPGGYVPALSEVIAAVEKAGLWITDVEGLRLHYAETLRLWLERFQARRNEAKEIYDERFFRMWKFYLATSEAMFRSGTLMVFQIQLAHRRDAAPLTRDYIGDDQTPLFETISAPQGPQTSEPSPHLDSSPPDRMQRHGT